MDTDARHSSTALDTRIAGLAPLHNLPPPRLRRLVEESSILDYASGHYVFRQGDRDAYLYYLLDGELDLYCDGELVSHLRGGTDEARFALAQLQPRQLSALPKTIVRVLRVQRERLDHHLKGGSEDPEAEPGDGAAAANGQEDWITRLLKAPIFARLPVANIQRLFAALEAVEVEAGQNVIEQGQIADAWYVIKEGLCEVERHLADATHRYKLAQLGPGDRFGEEALVAGGVRNATVRTLTSCTIMRLGEKRFRELVLAPVLKSVTLDEARVEIESGARWLDVRYPDEQAASPLPDSLDLPLNVLRQQAQSLDPDRRYIACCDNGVRSAVAAYLVADVGSDCVYLKGGLMAYPELSGGRAGPATRVIEHRAAAAGAAPDRGPARTETRTNFAYRWAFVPDKAVEVAVAAADTDCGEAGAHDPEVQAAILKAKLAQAQLELHEALRIKQEAEQALAAELLAKQHMQARMETTSQAEMERATALVAEAEAMKRQIEEAKRMAEADTLHRRREEEERLKALEASLEARIREREQKTEALAAMQEEELAQARMLREEAERQARAERERLEQEARAVEARLTDAQRRRERIEEELREAKGRTEAELRQGRSRVEAEMKRANALVTHAEAMKREIAEAKRAAEQEAARQRQVEEERIRGLKTRLRQKLRSKEQEIEEAAKRQADELAHIQRLKEEVAAELAEERKRFAREAMKAKQRLCQAEEAERAMEASRIRIAEEANRKHEELQALEKRLRSDIDTRLEEDKRRLEAELARAAGELAAAQRERETAEAARQAAAAEAERKIAEYRAVFERMHAEERAKLQAEKARLEAEALRIQGVLEEARRLKREAEAARLAAEEEITRLKRAQETTRGSKESREVIDSQIKVMEQRLARAKARENAAARAQDIAEGARRTTADELGRQREAEARLSAQIEAEIAEWRREQDAYENSPDLLEMTARLDRQIEVAKEMAKAARRATLAHDEKLLKEVSRLAHRA